MCVVWLGVALMSGCSAQSALTAQADIHVATRDARVAYYVDRAGVCSEEPTLAAWDTCMEPAITIQRAADSYRAALLSAQAALHAGRSEADLMPCVIVAARELLESLLAANVSVPEELVAIARLVPGGSCE